MKCETLKFWTQHPLRTVFVEFCFSINSDTIMLTDEKEGIIDVDLQSKTKHWNSIVRLVLSCPTVTVIRTRPFSQLSYEVLSRDVR